MSQNQNVSLIFLFVISYNCFVTPGCFCSQLVSSYVLHAQRDLTVQTLACRLLYDVLPGLETSVVFQETVCLYRLT